MPYYCTALRAAALGVLAMALVLAGDPQNNQPEQPGWHSSAVDCKVRRARWLSQTPSGATLLAFCGGDHGSKYANGAEFLSVDASGAAAPAKLLHDSVAAWQPMAPNSVVDMARVDDVEGEGLLLAGANGALHLMGLSVVESGADVVHQNLVELLVRAAGATGGGDALWQALSGESIPALKERAAASGLDVSAAALGHVQTTVHANSRQDYRPALAAGSDTVVTMDALGSNAALGCDGGSLCVVDLKRPDGAALLSTRESFCVNGVALLDRNATELASVCSGGLLKLWDWRQHAQPVMQLAPPPQETASLTCVAVRPHTSGCQMVTGSARGVVALWDTRVPDHPLSVFRPHEEHVWDVCFDDAGQSCFCSSNDGTVAEHVISDSQHGGMAQMHWVRRLVEQVMPVNCVTVDSNSGLVAAGTDGNAVYFTHRALQGQPQGPTVSRSSLATAPPATSAAAAAAAANNQQDRVARFDGQPAAAAPPPQDTPYGISPVIGSASRSAAFWSAAPGTNGGGNRGSMFTPASADFGGRLF